MFFRSVHSVLETLATRVRALLSLVANCKFTANSYLDFIILDHVAGGPLGGRRQQKQPSRKKEKERMEAQPAEEEERNERKWGEEGLSHANDAVRYVCRGAAVSRSNGGSFSSDNWRAKPDSF